MQGHPTARQAPRAADTGRHTRHVPATRLRVSSRAVRALAVLLVLCAAALPTGAAALVVHLRGGSSLSYQPLRGAPAPSNADKTFSNVEYNFGPVMTSNTDYAFYWDPPGAPAYPRDYRPGLNRFFKDLAHDSGGHANVDSVSTQYNDLTGEFAEYRSTFGGAINDTDPYPPNGCRAAAICLTDAQIRTEMEAYLAAHGLSADLSHEYFFLPPPGVEDCAEPAGRECSPGTRHPLYCAYHSAAPVGEGFLIYAIDPYVTGNPSCDDGNHPNGTTADGAIEGGLTHEQNESITDPLPGSAWEDTRTGEEVGDKCNFVMGEPIGTAPDGAVYNELINGHPYWFEEVWSNQGHSCMQRFTLSGSEPAATFTSAGLGSRNVSFDASGSTAPGGVVEYVWEFNYAPYSFQHELSHETTVRTTRPTVSFKFKKPGSFMVGLTVFAADGTSRGTAQLVPVS